MSVSVSVSVSVCVGVCLCVSVWVRPALWFSMDVLGTKQSENGTKQSEEEANGTKQSEVSATLKESNKAKPRRDDFERNHQGKTKKKRP